MSKLLVLKPRCRPICCILVSKMRVLCLAHLAKVLDLHHEKTCQRGLHAPTNTNRHAIKRGALQCHTCMTFGRTVLSNLSSSVGAVTSRLNSCKQQQSSKCIALVVCVGGGVMRDRLTDADRQTDTQTDRQTERQTDRHTEIVSLSLFFSFPPSLVCMSQPTSSSSSWKKAPLK